MEEKHFVYINGNARIGAHSLINISRSEHHIQGICTKSHSVKTYRLDRILKEYGSAEEASGSCDSFNSDSYSHLVSKSKTSLKKQTFDICFTGFKKADKERLIAVASENELTVRDSVTKNLQILCCGYNAGPSKVNAARMKGTVIIDESGFSHFIETGEIPDF